MLLLERTFQIMIESIDQEMWLEFVWEHSYTMKVGVEVKLDHSTRNY